MGGAVGGPTPEQCDLFSAAQRSDFYTCLRALGLLGKLYWGLKVAILGAESMVAVQDLWVRRYKLKCI